jgi:Flp pilus assembly protein TadB
MRFLLSVSFVLVQSLAFSQIDQKKLDSLSSSIDASVKAYQQWQDSFTKNQVKKSNKSNPATPVDIGILQQGKTKSKQSIYLIIMVILVFILMIFFFTRRKGAPVTKLFTTIVLSLFSFPILNAQHFDT